MQEKPPLFTRRAELLARLGEPVHYDLAIVGGGATGLGVALDAAARGFRVVLVESHDFAKGTSSRSTKLVHGGVRYLAQGHMALVREALRERALLLNNAPHLAQPLAFVMPSYQWWEMPFYGLGLTLYEALAGKAGLVCEDTQTGQSYCIHARCVINAAGVWVDVLRQQDGAARGGLESTPVVPIVAPSQGVHLVVDREFLAADVALMVPHTADGRVLFAVPWLGKVILGTTDTPRHDLAREPLAFKEEIDFILREAARYLRRAPGRADIKSIWVGLRPLVKPPDEAGESTPGLSRAHAVLVSRSGLVTVTGGKWTTYRAMAEEVMDECVERSLLERRGECVTGNLRLMGALESGAQGMALSQPAGLHLYGREQAQVMGLPGADIELCAGLTEAMVRFAARYEYAITVEDVLARRSRLLFLDARLARSLAAQVGQIMEQETGLDPQVKAFVWLVQDYLHAFA